MAEEQDTKALFALLELGKQTKEITIDEIDCVIKKLSFGEEYDIALLTGEMEQKGIPVDACQRQYAKQVVVTGTLNPKFDELTIDNIPFPLVNKIAKEILEFSRGLEKNS